jgi:hypothetical protein
MLFTSETITRFNNTWDIPVRFPHGPLNQNPSKDEKMLTRFYRNCFAGAAIVSWCSVFGCDMAIEAQESKTITNRIGAKLVLIPKGTFQTGSPPSEEGSDDDERQHKVTLTQDYDLGAFEVTQAQYEKVVGSNPGYFQGDIQNAVERSQQQLADKKDSERKSTEATQIVDALVNADTPQVSNIVKNELIKFRLDAENDLKEAFEVSPDDSNAKPNAVLEMLPDDKDELVASYWETAKTGETPTLRFQAACALACYDPENDPWQRADLQSFIARLLVGVRPPELLLWTNTLRPVKDSLTDALTTTSFQDGNVPKQKTEDANTTDEKPTSDDFESTRKTSDFNKAADPKKVATKKEKDPDSSLGHQKIKKAKTIKEGTVYSIGDQTIREEVNVGATEGFEPSLWSQKTFLDTEMRSISFILKHDEGNEGPVTIPIDYLKDFKALDLTSAERKMLRDLAVNLRSIEDKNGNVSFQVDFLFGGAEYILSNQREGPTNYYYPRLGAKKGENNLEIKTGDANRDGKIDFGEIQILPERF